MFQTTNQHGIFRAIEGNKSAYKVFIIVHPMGQIRKIPRNWSPIPGLSRSNRSSQKAETWQQAAAASLLLLYVPHSCCGLVWFIDIHRIPYSKSNLFVQRNRTRLQYLAPSGQWWERIPCFSKPECLVVVDVHPRNCRWSNDVQWVLTHHDL